MYWLIAQMYDFFKSDEKKYKKLRVVIYAWWIFSSESLREIFLIRIQRVIREQEQREAIFRRTTMNTMSGIYVEKTVSVLLLKNHAFIR